MSIIVEDDREKLGQQADEIRSSVVGKYGSIRARDLLEPRRLLRYHPREAAVLGVALALGIGGSAALLFGRRPRPAPPGRSPVALLGRRMLVGVIAIGAAELAKRLLRHGLAWLAAEERLALPPMPEPTPERRLSLEPPDVEAFTVKKRH
jgi:hypothetical protein